MSYKKLLDFIEMDNIAIDGDIEQHALDTIAADVLSGYATDKESRAEWEEYTQKAMKIAKQIREVKTTPWQNAANVKYPLITNSAISFASRAFSELIKDGRIVQVAVPTSSQVNNLSFNKMPQPEQQQEPQDMMPPEGALMPQDEMPQPDGMMPPEGMAQPPEQQLEQESYDKVSEMEDIANLISKHMSFQLLVEDDEWESDMDKLLHVLPIVGIVYKKTYYDEDARKPRSIMCLPDDIFVNENVIKLDSATRISHRIYMYAYEIKEYIRKGLFVKLTDDEISAMVGTSIAGDTNLSTDSSVQIELIEQHCRIDLDEDGYSEPYIVTVCVKTKKVLRIVSRYLIDDIELTDNDKDGDEVARIVPTQYFTDFHFLPAPDGKFHSFGYGRLLYPQNETINTLINQLLDAGTLSNRQAGFLSKGIRIEKGKLSLSPGEWITVPGTPGQALKDNVFPMPVREPSQVLLSLLQLIIKAGNDTANLSELLNGQQPTQNSPGVTVMALLEQGLKVDSSIQKRIRRSLKKEFEKLFNINREYLDDEIVFADGNEFYTVTRDIYMLPNIKIYPVADANMSSDAQRIARAQAMMEFKGDPYVDQIQIRIEYFKALQIPNIDKLIPQPSPDDGPTLEERMQEAEIEYKLAHSTYYKAMAETAFITAETKALTASSGAVLNASLGSQAKMNAIIQIAKLVAEIGIMPEQEAEQVFSQALLSSPPVSETDISAVSQMSNMINEPDNQEQPPSPDMMPPQAPMQEAPMQGEIPMAQPDLNQQPPIGDVNGQ